MAYPLGKIGGGNRWATPTNPWQSAFRDTYKATQRTPYGQQWKLGVAQAMQLGNRDYEGDMKRFAVEDINRERAQQQNILGSMGMREIALQKDVQDDWTRRSQDAQLKASMGAQQMKQSALDTMRGMLSSATGADLDRIGQMIAAAQAGGGNYNQFMQLLIPLMEKLGYNRG